MRGAWRARGEAMNDSRSLPPAPQVGDAASLPARAVNLARWALDMERQLDGRGRVEMQLIMLDGEWYLMTSQPGPVEWLGS